LVERIKLKNGQFLGMGTKNGLDLAFLLSSGVNGTILAS